jgi:hypothetical protein
MYRKTSMPSAQLHPGTLSAKLLAKFLLVCVPRFSRITTGKRYGPARRDPAQRRNHHVSRLGSIR